MSIGTYSIESVLPHAPPMILLDDIIDWEDGALTAGVTVRASSPFFVPGRGIAAHVAIEWMAQACGACVGVVARMEEQPVKPGLLLGTRNFVAVVPWFVEGQQLKVFVRRSYLDANIGVFYCSVRDGLSGYSLANAHLTVYQPDDIRSLHDQQDGGTRT